MSETAYIGLGSNLGDRQTNLDRRAHARRTPHGDRRRVAIVVREARLDVRQADSARAPLGEIRRRHTNAGVESALSKVVSATVN